MPKDSISEAPGAFRVFKATMTRARWLELSRIALTGLITLLYWRGVVPEWVLLASVAVGLYPLFKTGLIDLLRHRKLGTEIFVTLATILALATGETVAGAVIMVIILIAEFIAQVNTDRARASVRELIGSVPQTATLLKNGSQRVVPISELRVGDIVMVCAGEKKIPIDGVVVSGGASVNEAPITGESIPKDKSTGAKVFAGTVLETGVLDVQAEKVGGDTTFAQIVRLVEHAQENQAPVQKLADRVAAWLIPAVIVFLGLVYLFTRDARLIVTLLIFTSPAELGLATPLVIISSIARAARGGVLVKGGAFLEALAKADVMVFDKTGTLTTGKPVVTRTLPEPGIDIGTLVRLVAAVDQRSSHSLALAVLGHAADLGLEYPEATEFETLQGRGVWAMVEGLRVLLGTRTLLVENGVSPPALEVRPGETYVYVAAGGRAMGVLCFADGIRPEAAQVISELRATGVKRIVMLTGDNASTAKAVGEELGIDEIRADLLPQDKVAAIQELRQAGHCVAMIGDGINDAPALAAADVGVAMGIGGTQAAIEAADIALMADDLHKIVMVRALSRRAYRTIKENLFFGIGVVHVSGITAALLGWIGPVEAALLHLGPDVMVFLNSIKMLRVRLVPKRQ